jgi:hypothetical protein
VRRRARSEARKRVTSRAITNSPLLRARSRSGTRISSSSRGRAPPGRGAVASKDWAVPRSTEGRRMASDACVASSNNPVSARSCMSFAPRPKIWRAASFSLRMRPSSSMWRTASGWLSSSERYSSRPCCRRATAESR